MGEKKISAYDRKKTQTELCKVHNNAFFEIHYLDSMIKVVLIIPGAHRSYAYCRDEDGIYNAKESLSTRYFVDKAAALYGEKI